METEFPADRLKDAEKILATAAAAKLCGACRVLLRHRRVLPPIDFDRVLLLARTRKVYDEPADRVLPAKARCRQSLAQGPP